MTQLRREPGALSNYIDDLLQGIGKGGSSFTDLDSCAWRVGFVTHDGHSNPERILIQEIKQANEKMPWGQERALCALARLPNVSVWFVRVKENNTLWLADMADHKWCFNGRDISDADYRKRFADWWNRSSDTINVKEPQYVHWHELYGSVESFRMYIDATIARAHVELQALRVENEHLKRVIVARPNNGVRAPISRR